MAKNGFFDKLTKSIDWSQRQLAFPRRKYRELIKLSCGTHYAKGGADNVQPVNILKLYEKIYVQLLAPKVPRVFIHTMNPALKPAAADLELAGNQRIQEMHLENILRSVVTEALYSPVGVIKCSLAGQYYGDHAYGESFADVIPFCDYFCDMAADDWAHIAYEGNDYWMDYDVFKEASWIPTKYRNSLKPDEYKLVTDAGEEKAKSTSIDTNPVLFRDKIHLRDVWIPDERRMVTYAVTSEQKLVESEWTDDYSPDNGPYHKWIYSYVPGGNLLGMPPAAMWRDMHELMNNLFRKLSKQATDEKTVQAFPGGNEEDVENYRNATDGQGIATAGIKPENMHSGGVNQVTLAFFMQCKQLASYFASNIDTIGGLASQTETLGQERMLGSASSSVIADLSVKTIAATRELFRSIVKYEFTDPVVQRVLEKRIPGTDMSVSVPWYSGRRQGKWSDYDLDIDVYSLQDDSPQSQLQRLSAWMERYVMPLMPAIQQAGGTIDAEALIKKSAKYLTVKDADDIVIWTGDTQPQGQPTIQQPQVTERNYNRKSTPSPQNQDIMMMQSLLGSRQGAQ